MIDRAEPAALLLLSTEDRNRKHHASSFPGNATAVAARTHHRDALPHRRTVPSDGCARWLPDGKRLIVYATEPGKGDRLYVMGLGAKNPHPLTPWGSSWNWTASPDGSQVATFGVDGVKIYPISGGAARTIPGVPPVGERPIQWRADGRALYMGRVRFSGSRRFRIDEVDITTGKRRPWKELHLTDPADAEIVNAMMTPDGEAYAYSVWSSLSTLYLGEGLR